MTIPDNLKPPSFGTIYTETELRQAIANGEVQNLLGVGGGSGGGSSGGDATAVNQQIQINELQKVNTSLGRSSDQAFTTSSVTSLFGYIRGIFNLLFTIRNTDLISFKNSFGDYVNSPPATSDTANNQSFLKLFKRLLFVKLDRTLSQIETAINNIGGGKSLFNIEHALLNLRFTFFNTLSTDTISNVGDFHSVDVAQRGKHISFQYEVSGIGTSATFEIQFSNNQGLVNAQGNGTPLWSRLNEDDIVVTQNGLQEPIILNDVPASHIRLVMFAIDGGNPQVISYAMVTR